MTSNKLTLVTMTCQVLLVVTVRTRIDPVSDLPSWYPDPDERKPAPMPLLRVQGFVNTSDVDTGIDQLRDLATARAWLDDAGLIDPGARVADADLELARGMREGLRCLLDPREDRDNRAAGLHALRSVTESNLARLTVGDDGVVALEKAEEGSLGCGLFDLLLIVREAQEDGTWSRLKLCANPDCEWAFYDRSRNQQGSWCDMAVCGNRLKNRQLRARRR
jgi:predicted RNA-binding Zn ribbon-like protein